MSPHSLRVSACGTYHIDDDNQPAYDERFDEVLKFHAPGLAPVRRGGKAWHVRSDGAPAYFRRFLRTFGFYEGLAAVVAPEGWHHITPDGEDAYQRRYAWCGNFQQGRCTVRDADGSYYHITPGGDAAYPERWHYVGDYRDGVAVVQAADGCSTHIGLDGKPLHGQWFVDLDVFHKGYARARDDDGWMHVDSDGRPVYVRRFQAVEPFYNGQARVERFDGALEVIDEKGTTMTTLRAPRRSELAALSEDMVGFWRTQTIGAAVRLGVIEALPATELEIAERCQLRLNGAQRLLRALGELGLVSWCAGRWDRTRRGALLLEDHPLTLADAALEYSGPLSRMWTDLPEALRHRSAWSPPDIFGEVAEDEGRCPGHHRMLRSYARHDYARVASALDLGGTEHVVDAGGGVGVLAQRIADTYPQADVTVLERPEVAALGQSSVPQVHWRSASLFEPWGIRADAVVLARVLHDWDDAEASRILTNARATLSRGSRVYIIEMLLTEDGVAGGLCDLHLLMATGGRERTKDQFRELLAATGFDLDEVRRVPSLPSIIVGVAS